MNKYIPGIVIGVVVGVIFGFMMTFVFPEGPAPIGYGVGAAIFVAYIASNLAGNRKVPQASGAEKQAALQMQPPAGKSLLYVYREGFVAKLAGLNLQLDGTEFAQLTAPKFTCLVVAPGPHTLTCGFGGLAGPQSQKGVYEFVAPADGVAVVGIGVKMGLVVGAMSFTPITSPDAAKMKLNGMPMAVASPAEI
ncbi:MAG TPA: hypothetical protein VN814_24455 [Caulobacteraceae bacterium]|nr:hypothetical protein [Caulobacteraceae bacterium]